MFNLNFWCWQLATESTTQQWCQPNSVVDVFRLLTFLVFVSCFCIHVIFFNKNFGYLYKYYLKTVLFRTTIHNNLSVDYFVYQLWEMPKHLNSRCKELISSLISYFEKERDNNGPLLPLTAVREVSWKKYVRVYQFYLYCTTF